VFCATATSQAKGIIGTPLTQKLAIGSPPWIGFSLTLSATYGEFSMKTVTLDVRAPETALAEALAAAKSGKPQKTARISFASPELLWKVLTAKRWELLKAMCGAGPVSIREAARRVGRDVKAVHADVTALLLAGVIDRTESGQIEFPYEAVKVEFMLEAAEA
jgi:predicted transcriptional regulator